MPGYWTKMRNDLHEDPAVITIAEILNLDVDTVCGKLLRVWAWAGAHTVTGRCYGVTLRHVDRVTRAKDFGSAMVSAGWLEEGPNETLLFPRWAKHNGKAEKTRVLAAERAQRYRARKRDDQRDGTVTNNAPRREEKRYKENPPNPPQRGGLDLQAITDRAVQQHADEERAKAETKKRRAHT